MSTRYGPWQDSWIWPDINKLITDYSNNTYGPLRSDYLQRVAGLSLCVYETTDKEWKATIDLPGIDPSEVEVSLQKNSLTVSYKGKTKLSAIVPVDFSKSLSYDLSKLEAVHKHGQLIITIPAYEKRKEEPKKKIEIKVK